MAEVLRVEHLNAWYGESHILHGVDFVVNKGEVVTLLGRNGSGRTTTLKSIMGLVGRRSGSIVVEGRETVSGPVGPPIDQRTDVTADFFIQKPGFCAHDSPLLITGIQLTCFLMGTVCIIANCYGYKSYFLYLY